MARIRGRLSEIYVRPPRIDAAMPIAIRLECVGDAQANL